MLYDALVKMALLTVEMNVVPDFLLRRGIRYLLSLRLRELKAPTGEEQQRRLLARAGSRRRTVARRCAALTRSSRAGVCGGPETAAHRGADGRRQRAAL